MEPVPEWNERPFTGEPVDDQTRDVVRELLRTGVDTLVAGIRLQVLEPAAADDELAGYTVRFADPGVWRADVVTWIDVAVAEMAESGLPDPEEPTQLETWQRVVDELLTELAIADRTGSAAVETLARWATMAWVLVAEQRLTQRCATTVTVADFDDAEDAWKSRYDPAAPELADEVRSLATGVVDPAVPLLAELRDAAVRAVTGLLAEAEDLREFETLTLDVLADVAAGVAGDWSAAAVDSAANVGHARTAALAVAVRFLGVLAYDWPMRYGPLGAQTAAAALLEEPW